VDGSWLEAERPRLVRLCAVITRDRDAAEDLAQETLLEAWRNAHKLHDPSGADRWLSAIARHVCLRCARREGYAVSAAAAEPDAGVDLELELERAELAELLDRALALLPPETRDVLVRRFVDDSPYAEIAAQLGVSEDAVSMRITRGKLALRRLLGNELRDDAVAFGLADVGDEWQQTRVWCSQCGTRKLAVQRDENAISFRCPGCEPDDVPSAQFRLGNPALARLVGDLVRPAAILTRAKEWSWRYFGGACDHVACTGCGRTVPVGTYTSDDERFGARSWGLYALCDSCGEGVSSSVTGLALALPEVRAFAREHPRLRALPEREIERDGRSAVVLRFEDVRGSAGVDVVFARERVRLLEVAS
jgi:RNA polymerase sigma-70 factor (ECF subfamily)